MKNTFKKVATTLMAISILSVGMNHTNIINQIGCTAIATSGEISSPKYAYYVDVPFIVTNKNHKTGSKTVTHSPVMITYDQCSLGQAILKITISHSNGSSQSYYYTIPRSAGVSISHTISNCSAGDIVSYEVYPDSSINCVRAEGEFRLYY